MLMTLDLSNPNVKSSLTFAVDVDSVCAVNEYASMRITWPFLQCHYNENFHRKFQDDFQALTLFCSDCLTAQSRPSNSFITPLDCVSLTPFHLHTDLVK